MPNTNKNEFVTSEIVLVLNDYLEKSYPNLENKLKSLVIRKKGNIVYLRYTNDREWRQRHLESFKYLYKLYTTSSRTPFYCGCIFPKKKVEMVIVKSGNLYHFKTYPGQRNKHHPTCHFYDEPFDTIKFWNNRRVATPSILDFPKETVSYKQEKEEIQRPLTNSNKPRMTFTRFMRSLLDDTYGKAFNSINKNIDRLKDAEHLKLPTVLDVIKLLRFQLKERLPKGFKAFINLLTENQIEIGENHIKLKIKNKNKNLQLFLKESRIFGWDLKEEGFSSSTGNFLNIIIMKIAKNKKIITRSFFIPLLFIDERKPFIPIESKNEAVKIEKLLSKQKKIFKVITGTLSKNYAFLGYPPCITKILVRLTYYPDVIVFGEPLLVGEIVGFKDEKYKALKNRVKNEFYKLYEIFGKPEDCPIQYKLI
jgi:hypothetical protein